MTQPTASPSLNVAFDPWIPVLDSSCMERRVSLRDLIVNAAEFNQLASMLPTQRISLLRVALAVLQDVYGPDWMPERWYSTWEAGAFDVSLIDGYFNQYRERFELFSEETPFLQTPSLSTAKGETHSLARILADCPTGNALFSNRTDSGIMKISPEEAAVWLVHAMAFDTAGIKSGALGDDTVKAGKTYGGDVGWLGNLGLVTPIGGTLFETLMLNFLTRDQPFFQYTNAEDLPPWRLPVPTAKRNDAAIAPGPNSLLVWPSRRIKLFHDGEHVTSVLVARGDILSPQNMHVLETHSQWRYSKPQSKKMNMEVQMPRQFIKGRQVWRGIDTLLPQGSAGRGSEHGHPPGAVQFCHFLRNFDYLPYDYVIRLECTSVEYGPQQATYAEIVDDSIAVPLIAMGEDSESGATGVGFSMVQTAVSDVQSACLAYANLVSNVLQDQGLSGDLVQSHRDQAFAQVYALVDPVVRQWLASLACHGSRAETRDVLNDQIRGVVLGFGRDFIRVLPPSSWQAQRPVTSNPELSELAVGPSMRLGQFERKIREYFPVNDIHEEAT